MTTAQEQRYYTPEEYLELEVNSEERHEYINGKIILMRGGTPNHNQILGNFYAALNFALKRQPYRRRDTIINPIMIAEVLSKSTKSYDKDEKFASYRAISSFQEYILIDQ